MLRGARSAYAHEEKGSERESAALDAAGEVVVGARR